MEYRPMRTFPVQGIETNGKHAHEELLRDRPMRTFPVQGIDSLFWQKSWLFWQFHAQAPIPKRHHQFSVEIDSRPDPGANTESRDGTS